MGERDASARYYKRGKARRKIAQLADEGIPAVGDDDLPAMYHQYGDGKEVTLDGPQREIINPHLANIDKPHGALWSSPGRTDATGSIRTAWTDHNATEGNQPTGTLAELKAKPGAVVVTLSTPEEAEALMGRYGTSDEMGKRGFDWEAMREDGIDGVHVTSGLISQGKGFSYGDGPGESAAAANFDTWDASSTAWLSTTNLEVAAHHQPGEYNFKDDPDADSYSFPDLQPDDGFGHYDEPARPDMAAAWQKAPSRFRTTTRGSAKTGSTQGARSGDTSSAAPAAEGTASSQRDYEDALSQLRARLSDNTPAGNTGDGGGDVDGLDVLNAALKAVPTRKRKKQRGGKAQASR